MSPDDIKELANRSDPHELWRLPSFPKKDLTQEQYDQLMTGVLLRRHAAHLRQLERCCEDGTSLLITPLNSNSTAIKTVPTPEDHQKLRM